MTLYDFIKQNNGDYDTYDDVYDAVVTVCIDIEPEDDYDEFCVELCKLVEVKSIGRGCDIVCGWSDFITHNISVLRDIANKHWVKGNYKDEDDFIYEWIKEFHYLLAGYGDDGAYGWYKHEILDKCRKVGE